MNTLDCDYIIAQFIYIYIFKASFYSASLTCCDTNLPQMILSPFLIAQYA